MSDDRLNTEFCCSDCNKYFESASFLLTHFALHASQENKNNINEEEKIDQCNKTTNDESNECYLKTNKKNIPDLYPLNIINKIKDNNEGTKCVLKTNAEENDTSNKCNTEPDDFNPIKFCSISMEIKNTKKKYPCTFCTKVFGWSTDLKRHILTHTGQRPFKCKLCDATFTRNFLLQKHENKAHYNDDIKANTKCKQSVPNLEPIKNKESRKQNKEKIKRKCFYAMENEFDILQSEFTIIETGTTVQ